MSERHTVCQCFYVLLMGGLRLEVEQDLPLYIYRCSQLVKRDLHRTVKVTRQVPKPSSSKLECTQREGEELKKGPKVTYILPFMNKPTPSTLSFLFPLSLWHHYLLSSMLYCMLVCIWVQYYSTCRYTIV